MSEEWRVSTQWARYIFPVDCSCLGLCGQLRGADDRSERSGHFFHSLRGQPVLRSGNHLNSEKANVKDRIRRGGRNRQQLYIRKKTHTTISRFRKKSRLHKTFVIALIFVCFQGMGRYPRRRLGSHRLNRGETRDTTTESDMQRAPDHIVGLNAFSRSMPTQANAKIGSPVLTRGDYGLPSKWAGGAVG